MNKNITLLLVLVLALTGMASAQDIQVNYTMDSTSSPEPDQAGGDNDGVWNGDVTGGATGEFGSALSFDGSGDYLQANPTVDSGSFTYCVNFKTSSSSDVDLVNQFNGLGGYDNRINLLYVNGNLLFEVDDGTTDPQAEASGDLNTRDGNYHYICGVRDTSEGQLELWVDGNSEVNATDDTNNDLGTTGDLFVGKFSGDDFQGDIDEVEVFDYALTGSESSGGGSNSAPTLSNPTPGDGSSGVSTSTSLSIVTGDSDNSTLEYVKFYYGNDTLIDTVNSVSAGNNVSSKSLSLSSGTTYNWYASASDGIDVTNSSSYSFTTESSGGNSGSGFSDKCKAGWIFNEDSSPLLDKCGNFDGTWSGTITSGVSGISKASGDWGDGEAYSFDGSSAYVDVGDVIGDQDDYTISAWFKTSSVSNNREIFANRPATGGVTQIQLEMNSDGTIRAFDERSDTINTVDSSSSFDDGSWHHAIMEANRNGNLVLTIDDSQIGTASLPDSQISLSGNNEEIGVFDNAGTFENYWSGSIDEVKVFDTTLTSTEKTNLYEQNCIDGCSSSGNNNNLTEFSDPSPVDGAEDVSDPVELSLYVTDGDNATIQGVNATWSNGTLIESFSDVQNASYVNTTVSGLSEGTKYEWYYKADDGIDTVTSSTYSFTTVFKERGEFSLVSLPDTQIYSQDYPEVFRSQTSWIADVENEIDIRHVFHVGDIVNNGDTDIYQFDNANNSLNYLFNGSTSDSLGVSLAIGNHDYDDEASTRGATVYNDYFGVERFENEDWFGGVKDAGAMENSYSFFNASGDQYGVIKLEFCPQDSTLSWANQTVSNHPDKNWIYLTHTLIDDHGTFHNEGEDASCPYGFSDYNDGEGQWNNFIKYHENILFSINGHVPYEPYASNGTLTKQGVNGNTIHMIHMDYQSPPGPLPNGGDGWLRRMNFYPDQDIMEMQSYTPYQGEYNRTDIEQFNVSLDYVEATDTTPPTSSDNWSASGFVDQSSATVELTATDTGGSGVEDIYYRVNGGSYSVVQGSSATVTINNQGNNTLEYYAEDSAGNTEATNTEYVALETNSAPTASFTTTTTDLELGVDASGSSDSDGTISELAWDWTNDGNYETVINESEKQGQFYNVEVVSTSNGNKYLLNGTQQKNIDLEKGVNHTFNLTSSVQGHPFHISTSAIGGNFNGQITQGVSVTDPYNGNQHAAETGKLYYKPPVDESRDLYYQCGIHEYMGADISLSTHTLSNPTATHTYGSEGTYNVKLRVTDNDGAVDTQDKTISVSSGTDDGGSGGGGGGTTDTTPPDTTDNWDVSGFLDKTKAAVSLSATDGGVGVDRIEYQINGNGFTSVSGNTASIDIFTEGNNTLEYYAVDNNGNEEQTKTEYVAFKTSTDDGGSGGDGGDGSQGTVSLQLDSPQGDIDKDGATEINQVFDTTVDVNNSGTLELQISSESQTGFTAVDGKAIGINSDQSQQFSETFKVDYSNISDSKQVSEEISYRLEWQGDDGYSLASSVQKFRYINNIGGTGNNATGLFSGVPSGLGVYLLLVLLLGVLALPLLIKVRLND